MQEFPLTTLNIFNNNSLIVLHLILRGKRSRELYFSQESVSLIIQSIFRNVISLQCPLEFNHMQRSVISKESKVLCIELFLDSVTSLF